MPRLSKDQWDEIRTERELGVSFADLAAKHGVSKTAVIKKAHKEGWVDKEDAQTLVRKKVSEKLSGVPKVSSVNQEKKAELIEEAAIKVVRVVEIHRREWEDHREKFRVPDEFETGKVAKITSEMLMIRQKGERLAYGLDESVAQQTVVIDRTFTK